MLFGLSLFGGGATRLGGSSVAGGEWGADTLCDLNGRIKITSEA